jgi:hypothetical protein
MNTENLEPITRMIVREVAYGLSDADICVNHPEFQQIQIAKMRGGATFKRALKEMQAQIDQELVEKAAKAGYAAVSEQGAVPLIMLSPEKLASVLSPKAAVLDSVPDSVDGHNGGLEQL